MLTDNKFGRFECVVLDIAPGFVADGGVGLPVERANVAELAALEIKHRRMFLQGVVLVIDDADVIAVFERAVVVKRGKACEVGANGGLADPPIEIKDVRMIFFDKFGGACQPIIGPR